MTRKRVHVVGAVLENELGEFLCALRSGQMAHPYHWEFPGGKIEAGETPQAALVREVQEELGCQVEVGALVADVVEAYPALDVHLTTYRARVIAGSPVPREHLRLLWLPREAMLSLQWGAADVPTVQALMGLV